MTYSTRPLVSWQTIMISILTTTLATSPHQIIITGVNKKFFVLLSVRVTWCFSFRSIISRKKVINFRNCHSCWKCCHKTIGMSLKIKLMLRRKIFINFLRLGNVPKTCWLMDLEKDCERFELEQMFTFSHKFRKKCGPKHLKEFYSE